MRKISIKKLSNRHYAVYMNGEIIYENIDRNSCLKYLRRDKKKFLRKSSRKSSQESSGA